MTEQITKNTIMGSLLTGGVASSQTINHIYDKAKEIKEKTINFVKENAPKTVQSGLHSANKFRKSRLGRKLMSGVALAALVSGYATTGIGYVVQTADRIAPEFLQNVRNVMVNKVIDSTPQAAEGIYNIASSIGKPIYENMPAKETIEGIVTDIGQLADGINKTIPSDIKNPISPS